MVEESGRGNPQTIGLSVAMIAGAPQAAVAKPFGDSEGEKKSAKWDAHERDDEGEPAGIGAGACGAEAAEQRLKQNCGQHARAHHRRSPLQKLARAVVG